MWFPLCSGTVLIEKNTEGTLLITHLAERFKKDGATSVHVEGNRVYFSGVVFPFWNVFYLLGSSVLEVLVAEGKVRYSLGPGLMIAYMMLIAVVLALPPLVTHAGFDIIGMIMIAFVLSTLFIVGGFLLSANDFKRYLQQAVEGIQFSDDLGTQNSGSANRDKEDHLTIEGGKKKRGRQRGSG